MPCPYPFLPFMPEFPFGQAVAWRPDPAAVERTNLAAFWKKQGLDSYDALLAWAVEDVGRFWDAALEDLGVEFYEPYTRVLDASAGIERPRWQLAPLRSASVPAC